MTDFDEIDKLIGVTREHKLSSYVDLEAAHLVMFYQYPHELAFRFIEEHGWFVRVGEYKNAPIPVDAVKYELTRF